ncbi:MAG: hypothetical protein DRN15_06060 [Thermoprotei archaeon]|mgnify:CR=1 FL=1|nr:MAG: hypothetical protein DRM97_07130 [Thermoprotei archaeon]RLF23502.1 MAG: hypothetical protein DRN15_06060 [Thermoprotei archaeon]
MMDYELLRAYLTLVRVNRPVGVRQFQRIMNYRSPGKASRVLEQLVKRGLAKRLESGDYVAVKNNPILWNHMIIAGLFIPRLLPLAISFIALYLTYWLLTRSDVVFFTLSLLAPIMMLIEAIRAWMYLKRMIPHKRAS